MSSYKVPVRVVQMTFHIILFYKVYFCFHMCLCERVWEGQKINHFSPRAEVMGVCDPLNMAAGISLPVLMIEQQGRS